MFGHFRFSLMTAIVLGWFALMDVSVVFAQGQNQNSGTQTGGGGSDFSLDRPELTTDIDQLTEGMQSGFVGGNDEEGQQFFGAGQAGENANNRGNRNFNTRSQSQNVNQGQTQPMYRTFGQNNVPYRSPHKIAFQVPAADGRVMDLKLNRRVRVLASRSPQFRNVIYEIPESRMVVLRGFVPTERDKQLAMLYMKMEPGIDRVVNQLQVGQASSRPPAPPLPNATQP